MKIIKLYIFSLIFCLLINFNLKSQIIGGKVVQVNNRMSVPYTTLAVEGTTLGIVSDFEGNFVFEFPEMHSSGKLIVTCVGFKDRILKLNSISGRLDLVIELEPVNVEIEEVVVEQKSLLPYSIIKRAVDAANVNYINKAYNYELYYKNIDKTSERKEFKREAVLLLYDMKGYQPTSVYNTFKEINYSFLQSKRNFDVDNIRFGNTNIDDLLEFDIMRHQANITDKRRIYDFDIIINDEIIYKGDSVWVLTYQCNKPDLLRTGDFSASSYSGEIFIKKKDYAVLYNKTTVKKSNPYALSRNLYKDKNIDKSKINNAVYNFEVRYKKSETFYVLDLIKYNITFSYMNPVKGQILSKESELDMINVKVNDLHEIEIRDYFENIEFDAVFWKDFFN